MNTVRILRDQLNVFLKNKNLTMDMLNRQDDPESIRMDFKYQP